MMFVSHNLATVRYVSDVLAVMYLGRIVEVGPTDAVVSDPQHPYTRTLLDAVPRLGESGLGEEGMLEGESHPIRTTPRPAATSIRAARSGRWSTRARQVCVDRRPVRRRRTPAPSRRVPLRRRACTTTRRNSDVARDR